jgi:outer membrane protein TolC
MPIDKEFNIVPPSELPELNIEINTAVKKAIENNSELMELAINRLQAERELERIESQNSFNATLSASYGLNKSTLDANDLYSKLLDQERFNLNFSIPLFQWGKGSSEIEAALASQNSTEVSLELRKKEFEIKVKYEVLRFLQLQKQVGVAARSDTIASKRFEVAKNRYMIGKINMNDLFLAQREKDSASQSYFSTLMNFWVSYYSLRKLTLYDFEKNKNLEYKY